MKTLVLVLLSIFAPPLLWFACGGQLIYASRLARRRRLTDKTHLLIRTHTTPSLPPNIFFNVAGQDRQIHRQPPIGPPTEQAPSRSLLHLVRSGSEHQANQHVCTRIAIRRNRCP